MSGKRIDLDTKRGSIVCAYHEAPGEVAVLWVFGAGGGLGGPAGGLYARLADEIAAQGMTSLRLDYRRPGMLRECVFDVLAGEKFLVEQLKRRIVLVGHSFGGAVAISAAVRSKHVSAVAALSSQTFGAEEVSGISPRPLLLVHGEADDVLPCSCSNQLYAAAREPKQLIIYPNCSHGLDECRDDLDRDLLKWLSDVGPLALGNHNRPGL